MNNDNPNNHRRSGGLWRALGWVAGHEPHVLVALGVAALAIWFFAELADEVLEGETRPFDRTVLLALREPGESNDPRGPVWIEESARDITALGGMAVLVGVTFAAAGYLALAGHYRHALLVLVAVFGGIALMLLLKEGFARPRPDLVPHGTYVYTASFPSGHSMMAAVTYLTLGALLAKVQARRRLRAYTLLVAVFVTLLVGVTRVYLGVHWPTDVLAGWAVGAAWAVLCYLAITRIQRGRSTA